MVKNVSIGGGWERGGVHISAVGSKWRYMNSVERIGGYVRSVMPRVVRNPYSKELSALVSVG